MRLKLDGERQEKRNGNPVQGYHEGVRFRMSDGGLADKKAAVRCDADHVWEVGPRCEHHRFGAGRVGPDRLCRRGLGHRRLVANDHRRDARHACDNNRGCGDRNNTKRRSSSNSAIQRRRCVGHRVQRLAQKVFEVAVELGVGHRASSIGVAVNVASPCLVVIGPVSLAIGSNSTDSPDERCGSRYCTPPARGRCGRRFATSRSCDCHLRSGVEASTSTIGSQRRVAAIASPSRVWAVSRTRSSLTCAVQVSRSTTGGEGRGGVSHGDLTRLSGSATRFVRRPR
jgi:hypothetical protein